MNTRFRVVATVLGAPHAGELARFYARLTGWPVAVDEGDWAILRDPAGGVGLSFQTEADYRPPVWPQAPGAPQMMMHLDIAVDDLDGGVGEAIAAGARLAAHQPQEDVRVLLDPAGHPFCLFLDSRRPADVCRAYLDAFATGDPDQVTQWVTDDFANRHTAALGSGCVGKAEYSARVPGFLASMPGLRYEVVDVVNNGDRVDIAYLLRAHVNGNQIALPGVMRLVVRDGLIAERTDYWDSLSFQRQAGLA